jgi:hypothetical protein
MAATVAAKNKKVREEALREQLRQKGLHTQVINIAEKLEKQHLELESSAIQALKASADLKMRLINKYMPDVKSVELSTDPESPLEFTEITTEELKQRLAQYAADE